MIATLSLLLLMAPPTPTPNPTPAPTPSVRILLKRADEPKAIPAGKSLAEVAKTIKLRLPKDAPRVLTNESIRQLAEGVELTTAAPAPANEAPAGGSSEETGSDAERKAWQDRYQNARASVAYWQQEVKRLESEVARLENQFYATDDPAYRDGVVKPAWDKALVDLRTARAKLDDARKEPQQVLDDARRAGALPGWFRGLSEPTVPAQPPATPSPFERP